MHSIFHIFHNFVTDKRSNRFLPPLYTSGQKFYYIPFVLLSLYHRISHNNVYYNNDKCVPLHRQISFSSKCDTLPPILRLLSFVALIVVESYLLMLLLHLVFVCECVTCGKKENSKKYFVIELFSRNVRIENMFVCVLTANRL